MSDWEEELKKEIENADWEFAWSYAQTLPHEYVAMKPNQRKYRRLFELMERKMKKDGFTRTFGDKEYTYVIIDGFKYWFTTNGLTKILNREWLDGYEIDLNRRKFKRIIKKKEGVQKTLGDYHGNSLEKNK